MRLAAFALAATPSLLLPLAACDEPAAPAQTSGAAPVASAEATSPEEVQKGAAEEAATPAVAPPAATGGVMKTVSFPSGDLIVPEAWNPKLRTDPPMTAMHVMPALGMTCDLAVLEGHGTTKQAEEYLAAGANAYQGDVQRGPDLEVGGHVFQGILVTKPKALPDAADAVIEVYAAISGEDLVGIGVTRLDKSDAVEAGRRSCLQAFAQLTTVLPRGAPTGD